MTADVLRPNEIILNGTRFPVTNKVKPQLASQQPQRMVTGTFGKANNPLVDSLILDDFRTGILVEHDLGEPRQAWWSTVDIRFPNSFVLPPLATAISVASLITGVVTSIPTIVNPNMELTTGWTGGLGAQSTTQTHSGTYSWKCYKAEYQLPIEPYTIYYYDDESVQALNTWTTNWRSKAFTFYCWVYGTNTKAKIGINDGIDTTYATLGVTNTWTFMSVTKTLAANATKLELRLLSVASVAAYFDDALVCVPYGTSLSKPANFNGSLYWGLGSQLITLNATGDGFTSLKTFPNIITDLVSSVTSNLYIMLGATNAYWYMNTAEAFLPTDQLSSVIGVHWDAKLYALNTTTGQLYYEATPATYSPGFTADALLDLNASTAQRILTYRDAYYGNPVIYLASKAGLWVHDATDHIWLESELVLPEHTNVGKGAVVWQSDLYLSSGLSVVKYRAGSQAAIDTKIGLDQYDGVPSEYRGEIINMIKGFGEMYALVDSSQSTGVGTSWVAAYDGYGWRPIWIDSTTDQAMQDGVVSSDYAYRLWFGANNVPTYIGLSRDAQNPKKNSAYTYAAAGTLITPWYTGQWEGGVSRALALKLECADMTATETITVQYRIDHATTALDSTWTTLGVITANGQTTYKFPSDSTPAGTVFRAIQFRFDFARGATTTTSPVLRYAVFEFQKVIPTAWGWAFQIDCTKPYDGKSAAQLIDAYIAAVASTTLVPFVYDDETAYVEVLNAEGDRQTGEVREGIFNVLVRAPQ